MFSDSFVQGMRKGNLKGQDDVFEEWMNDPNTSEVKLDHFQDKPSNSDVKTAPLASDLMQTSLN